MAGLDDAEDALTIAEVVRQCVKSQTNRIDRFRELSDAVVAPKLERDMVVVSGFGFAITINGEQYIIGVEKV